MMKPHKRKRFPGPAQACAALLAACCAALSLSACPLRLPTAKPAARQAPAQDSQAEARGPDPRAAFESSGMLGGLSSSTEAPVPLIAATGLPESGVTLALGAALSTAAIARRSDANPASLGQGHELALASGARASLPGPVLSMAAVGERIVAACADPIAPPQGTAGSPAGQSPPSSGGSLLGFKTEGEGERLVEVWKSEGTATRRLLALPGGRVAAADESAGLRVIDAASGTQVWAQKLQADAADIAYAPGLVLAAAGSSLEAFDESTGASLWRAALTAQAGSLSAGNGVALVLAVSGSLSVFSLSDGKGIGAAPGPFDPSLKAIADGSRAIAGLAGGGAVEIDVKSGQSLRSWSWEGRSSFMVADRDRIYVGLDGREGKGILLLSRAGESGRKFSLLSAPPFDAPLAVGGARGGLLVLLMDGSLVLVGKEREVPERLSALDSAIAAPPETALAIATALGRFRPRDNLGIRQYLRFDLFAAGMPLDDSIAFTAFRYQPPTSAKRRFYAKPEGSGEVVAIFDESGHELGSSIDELSSSSGASAFFEKGRVYWICAGWTFQAQPQTFRLFVK